MAEQTITLVPIPKLKRGFDIITSILLIGVLSPVIFCILVWIGIEQMLVPSSRGPLFYCETRISGGKRFQFCKFRIFKQAVLDRVIHESGFIHTKPLEKNPDNMTAYGRFLKKVYLDEFPQFFNVLKGDMSIVGPRPTNVVNSERMRRQGIYTKYRIRCGITGPFQAHKGRKTQRFDQDMDNEYIAYVERNPGWKVSLYDLAVLWHTVITVLRAKGE